MTKTILYAPLHVIPGKPALGNQSNNPDRAPQIRWGAGGLMDGRLPFSQGNRMDGVVSSIIIPNIIGLYGEGLTTLIDQVPSTISATNIAAAQHAASVALNLVGASGAGITLLGTALPVIPAAAANATGSGPASVPAGSLAIDGVPGYIKFGAGFQTWFYDPTTMLSRAITITGAANGTGGNFLISGYDVYGYAMSQLLAVGAGAVSATTTKAFKFVSSVVAQFTDAHNYSVGTADVFGFPMAVDRFAYTRVFWDSVLQLTATVTAADATTPATTATGDVRGTFTPGSASDGAKRLVVQAQLSLARAAVVPMHNGIFGVPQV
jgi:hypothetical protein